MPKGYETGPFADVVTKAALSTQLFKTLSVGPARVELTTSHVRQSGAQPNEPPVCSVFYYYILIFEITNTMAIITMCMEQRLAVEDQMPLMSTAEQPLLL